VARPSPACRSLKNPYFSVSGKMSVQRTKIIGERNPPPNPLAGKRGRLSGQMTLSGITSNPIAIYLFEIIL
jgi:hypothetical protein